MHSHPLCLVHLLNHGLYLVGNILHCESHQGDIISHELKYECIGKNIWLSSHAVASSPGVFWNHRDQNFGPKS